MHTITLLDHGSIHICLLCHNIVIVCAYMLGGRGGGGVE